MPPILGRSDNSFTPNGVECVTLKGEWQTGQDVLVFQGSRSGFALAYLADPLGMASAGGHAGLQDQVV